MDSNDTLSPSRREFLQKVFTATVFATTAPATLLGQVIPTFRHNSDALAGRYTIDLNNYPALAQVNGSVKITIPGMPISWGNVILTRTSATTFAAVSDVCTHQGWAVNVFNQTTMRLRCPRHGSEFTAEGEVLKGPAGAPLRRFETFYDGASIVEVEVPGISGIDDPHAHAGISLDAVSLAPGSSLAIVQYTVTGAADVVLAFHAMDGREVLRLVDARRDAGTFNVPCDLSSLPPGAYLCELRAAGVARSLKFVVSR